MLRAVQAGQRGRLDLKFCAVLVLFFGQLDRGDLGPVHEDLADPEGGESVLADEGDFGLEGSTFDFDVALSSPVARGSEDYL